MKMHVHPYRLLMRGTFTTAHGAVTHRDNLRVELSHEGHIGLGEVTAISYYHIEPAQLAQTFRQVRPMIEQMELLQPERFYHSLYAALRYQPFALSAIDMAAWDLFGKLHGQRSLDYLQLDERKAPLSSLTISLQSPASALDFIDDNPWPIYKIKLGGPDDLKLMQTIRRHTNSVLRVDANSGWNVEETIEKSQVLQELGVEFIEQPLPAHQKAGYAGLQERCALPLIADESCHVPGDVSWCAEHFAGINIKLMKCGGITPALMMIKEARRLGIKVMIGCMTETSIGISAAAQLLPLVDYADIDGSLLITNDNAEGVKLSSGHVIYPSNPGNGVTLRSSTPPRTE